MRSKLIAPDFGAFRPEPMAAGLLGVFRDEPLQIGLYAFVFLMSRAGSFECSCEFRPAVRRAHIDNTNRLKPRPRWLYAEQARCLAVLNAAPEFPFCRDQEMLVEWIGVRWSSLPICHRR